MGLLDKLTNSRFSINWFRMVKHLTKYDGVSQYQKDLATSQLDLDGKHLNHMMVYHNFVKRFSYFSIRFKRKNTN